MSWLLWTLLAAGFTQTYSLNSTAAPSPRPTEPYLRASLCRWPCSCPPAPPACPPGVSLLLDGCGCCKACARQAGASCNEANTCDFHKGLYCDYSSDAPRYERGVCAYMVGAGCEHDGVIYRNGQSFRTSCRFQCVCVNGAIGCVPLCESQPPRVWCPAPRRVKLPGQCCERWICDETRRGRKTTARHALAAPAETVSWHKNCISQTTPWGPCSRTCGRGLSLRVSNANERCEMEKESRLCTLRPCEVDITQHIKPGKKCLNIYREEKAFNFTISGCVSTKPYRPKYCGVCTDERCCIPYKSKTIQVDFQCPSGSILTWQLMWVQACFCNLSCRSPNDIFADLESYYGYPEVMN
ncbi:hypothetical protein NHX12_034357 [Muraenolepis orangiensis]|uniref:Connective tissue growth factor n=1 Tax=Muraenolepis orangiensis TaxID=630683 RepID=A0A9Q0I1W7_9TELE|nr:hypothetical protein NHX12_034357 [Muraenolepis orangiensis]